MSAKTAHRKEPLLRMVKRDSIPTRQAWAIRAAAFLLSLLTGGADFSQWQWVLREAVYDAGGSEVRAAVAINYGSFLSTILDFLIIAFAVFCLIKAINRFHRKKEAAPPPPPQPSQEEVLLAEIRDLLKERT